MKVGFEYKAVIIFDNNRVELVYISHLHSHLLTGLLKTLHFPYWIPDRCPE